MKSFFSSFLSFLFGFTSSLRFLNLLLIILTQTLTNVFLLDNKLCFSKLFLKENNNNCVDIYLAILATVLSAAAGYILNDCFDRKIDVINFSKRGLFTERYLYILYFFSVLFFGIALLIGISIKIGSFIFLSIGLLIFYAQYSKKIGIFKPVVVSLLTTFSILLVGLLDSSQKTITPIFSFFLFWSFLLSMCREIIKDFEDLKGDTSQNGFTSVVQLGKKNSILLLSILSILLIFSLIISIFFSTNTISNVIHRVLMILLTSIFIFLLNNKKNHCYSNFYKKVSLFCKIIMLIGILGMIVY